jgi:multisubunit Na+/H+ antiporter MnhC subunit
MTAVLAAIRRVLLGTGSTAFTLVGALVIGFGVPLFWIFIASQFYGKTGAVNGPVAVFIGTGILVSYYGLLLIASWVRARLLRRDAARVADGRDRRASWNRSMRDSSYRPGQQRSDPVERLFVATAIVSMIAFLVWFAFFAGAPFPNSPG